MNSYSLYKKSPPETMFGKRKKTCPFTSAGVRHIDYKDIETLLQFITERGKIIPRRVSSISLHHQRMLSKAIKRARYMALLPFVSKD